MTRKRELEEAIYVKADLSGIQDYVLGIGPEGKGQAKRLRARSFVVELVERAALARVRAAFSVADSDVLVRGGGGFFLRIDHCADLTRLDRLRRQMQRELHDEFGGEIRIVLAWGRSAEQVHRRLEHLKRRPWEVILQNGDAWNPNAWHLPSVVPLCQLCGRFRAPTKDQSGLRQCDRCQQSTRLGEQLATWKWMRTVSSEPRGPRTTVLGTTFAPVSTTGDEVPVPHAFPVRRRIPREVSSGRPLTFEQLARMAQGASRLAVLKADVDDVGLRVEKIVRNDGPVRLREFSRDLHSFFAESIQDLIGASWPSIYTVFAGGDDLLLVGPWDTVLDFARDLHRRFKDGPGQRYAGLTFCAGVALAAYRLPVRHAVGRAEELLDHAKKVENKNSCSSLGATWPWKRHGAVISEGKRLARSVDAGTMSRSLIQRLLTLLDRSSDVKLRAARWSYQIGRHGARFDRKVSRWAEDVLRSLANHEDIQRLDEAKATMRYALLATQGVRKEDNGR